MGIPSQVSSRCFSVTLCRVPSKPSCDPMEEISVHRQHLEADEEDLPRRENERPPVRRAAGGSVRVLEAPAGQAIQLAGHGGSGAPERDPTARTPGLSGERGRPALLLQVLLRQDQVQVQGFRSSAIATVVWADLRPQVASGH